MAGLQLSSPWDTELPQACHSCGEMALTPGSAGKRETAVPFKLTKYWTWLLLLANQAWEIQYHLLDRKGPLDRLPSNRHGWARQRHFDKRFTSHKPLHH
ncbi:hypothetical protein VFPPC_18134 [Pochonia chlamydosporia 170]|uniref:Uncharacterized protein n=1 Tax=Pochonia chlamydosporia 170 TaxID=1380566 RepID=A0A219APU2_METCM|nr:hypothetical protein VFPPC_18134 [Pochonia chlamydosporia 170]OWT42721.1 hypothetical protein VFPPC_18134 [Pochonia chlamydosporia 170]